MFGKDVVFCLVGLGVFGFCCLWCFVLGNFLVKCFKFHQMTMWQMCADTRARIFQEICHFILSLPCYFHY